MPWVVYLVALGARLTLLAARPYGDEALYHYLARAPGHSPANIVAGGDLSWLVWARPVFVLLLSPGAQASFDDFRVNHMLIASAVAPLLLLWVRQRGGSWAAATAAGLVGALHPFLVVWGVRAFPDGIMVTLYVAGLLLWEQRRWGWALAALLAAAWTKEVALVGIAVLAAEEVVAAARAQRAWPPVLGLRHMGLAAVLLLAYVPQLIAQGMGGRPPGWSRGGDVVAVLDDAFTTILLLPFVVAALWSARARRPALHALAYVSFYIAYHIVLGGAPESWYFVQPFVLGVASLALAADAWAGPRRVSQARPRLPGARSGPLSARLVPARLVPAIIVTALLLLQAELPSSAAAKDALHPATDHVEWSAAEAYRHELARDDDMWHVIDAARPEDWGSVLLVDVGWFFAVWPFSDRAGLVHSVYTDRTDPAQWWADRIELDATMTFVHVQPSPLNEAIREVYADCVAVAEGEYLMIRGRECEGRVEQLAQHWSGSAT